MTAEGAQARRREEQIRAILAAHADQVIPAGGLTEIRSRVAARRPWWRRAWDRLTRHTCDWRGDWIDPGTLRCRICGQRYEDQTAAPGESGAAAKADYLRGQPAMTTIIPRRARDLHAGDIITHDPDHDRDVRWWVSDRPQVTSGGVAIIYYWDLADGSPLSIAHFDALTELAVEPAGGGKSSSWPDGEPKSVRDAYDESQGGAE